MAPVTRVRPRIGDVVEIPTPRGLAYAQFTHKHTSPPRYGDLVRVLPGVFAVRPDDFSALVNSDPQFVAFIPLGPACARKLFHIVANESVPPVAQVFPLFRSSARGPGGVRGPWWLWDGTTEWRVGELKPGMEKLPIRGTWNYTLLLERITQGWRHEHDA